MTPTEIKKQLYKQKPIANFNMIRKGLAYYSTTLNVEDGNLNVTFEIPVVDMGDTDFGQTIPAQLLIRWLVETE